MQYKAKQDAKLWKDKALTANIGLIKNGTTVTGSNIGGGILQLTTPVGYTKAIWFTEVPIVIPPDPPSTGATLTHTVEIFDDGSIKVDGTLIP